MAVRQRLTLNSSRRRDIHAWDYGLYTLTDITADDHPVITTGTLPEIHAYLIGRRR